MRGEEGSQSFGQTKRSVDVYVYLDVSGDGDQDRVERTQGASVEAVIGGLDDHMADRVGVAHLRKLEDLEFGDDGGVVQVFG